jgi:hypothetical protein
MIIQCTLMTSHKGVDLHAETASRVIRRDIAGGDRLLHLFRAEIHTFWRDTDQSPPETVERLLDIGRFYNPNKHHYGHFELPGASGPWFAPEFRAQGDELTAEWPGEVIGTDWSDGTAPLFTRLAGIHGDDAAKSIDVCTFPIGESGPLLSGVFWRLVLADGAAGTETPAQLASRLIVAGGAGSGFLVNPHMQGWLIAAAR